MHGMDPRVVALCVLDVGVNDDYDWGQHRLWLARDGAHMTADVRMERVVAFLVDPPVAQSICTFVYFCLKPNSICSVAETCNLVP